MITFAWRWLESAFLGVRNQPSQKYLKKWSWVRWNVHLLKLKSVSLLSTKALVPNHLAVSEGWFVEVSSLLKPLFHVRFLGCGGFYPPVNQPTESIRRAYLTLSAISLQRLSDHDVLPAVHKQHKDRILEFDQIKSSKKCPSICSYYDSVCTIERHMYIHLTRSMYIFNIDFIIRICALEDTVSGGFEASEFHRISMVCRAIRGRYRNLGKKKKNMQTHVQLCGDIKIIFLVFPWIWLFPLPVD